MWDQWVLLVIQDRLDRPDHKAMSVQWDQLDLPECQEHRVDRDRLGLKDRWVQLDRMDLPDLWEQLDNKELPVQPDSTALQAPLDLLGYKVSRDRTVRLVQ